MGPKPEKLRQANLALRTERREGVTQIDCVVTVAVEIGTRREPWRGDPVDHGSVAQYGQVEAVAVKGHETRTQLRDLVAEGGDQLVLRPPAHVRRADGVHCPVVAFPVSDDGPDADGCDIAEAPVRIVRTVQRVICEGSRADDFSMSLRT
jgi:hypothetical protein